MSLFRVRIWIEGYPGVWLHGKLRVPTWLPWWPRRLPIPCLLRLDRDHLGGVEIDREPQPPPQR